MRYHRGMNITKRMIREAVGGRDVDVARFFNVTRGAVAQWGENDPLPEGRQWQARAKLPEKFPTPADPVLRGMSQWGRQ